MLLRVKIYLLVIGISFAGFASANDSVVVKKDARLDILTAKQIAHMLWYVMDGIYKGKAESLLADRDNFNEFKMAFAEIETTFLQSKKTGRWWMEVADGKMVACSHQDYLVASSNDIPERWLRAAERI